MTDIIEQGEQYNFTINVDDPDGLTCAIAVMQYPGDTPAISKNVTLEDDAFKGTLTSTETAALDIGQWFIHSRIHGSSEDLREPLKFYVAKGWI